MKLTVGQYLQPRAGNLGLRRSEATNGAALRHPALTI